MAVRVQSDVTTPASSHALTTLTNVKADLGIADTMNDTYLTMLIARASAAIEQFCNRTFVVEGMTETFYPDRDYYAYQVPGGMDDLQLSRFPVVAITSVVENDVTLTVGTEYLVSKVEGRLTRLDSDGNPRRWGVWPVTVIYTAGYSTIPADLEDACSRLVKARWLAKGRDPMLRSEVVEGIGKTEYWVSSTPDTGNLPPEIADACDNYRVPVIA